MSDKYKHIDDLFRDKFKDFELDPPDHVWSNIKQQMHGSGNGGKGSNFKNGGIYGISIILIIAGILSWYLLSSSTEDNKQVPIIKNTQVEDTEYKSSTRTLAINSDTEKDQNFSDNPIGITSKNKRKQKTRFDISEPAEVDEGKASLLVIENIAETDYTTSNQQNNTGEIVEYTADIVSAGLVTPGSDEELLAIHISTQSEVEIPDEIPAYDPESTGNSSETEKESENIESEAGLETVPDLKSDYGHKGSWMFGIFFTPEMIFYPDNNNLNNRSYALDVNAIYKFSGYLLQSGLGVSWTSDEGNSEIDYNKYLGSYEDVYNVTFDTIGNELIPVYHTESVKVYDSIDHLSIMPTKSHYTYLQIPVLFGYGNESKRFGWFVKGGPSLSIMIHKDISSSNMSGTEDKILRIENEIPSRINTNWQFVFTGGVSYRLSNHLSFTTEPVFRYYFNPTYEKSKLNLKNPYSLGLRVGFLVDL